MGFELPEISATANTPEEVAAATAYVKREAPDLLSALGLNEGREDEEPDPVTYCSKGHEFTEENTLWRSDGRSGRRCRRCKNDYTREWSKNRPSRRKEPQ